TYTLSDILHLMRNLSINLDVPMFRQIMNRGRCGPACLLMVLKYLNPDMEINRLLEFRVGCWPNCFLLE
ncbi:hypothetical protein ACFL96_18155, partial [Thermoproteota archaeon]